MNFKYIIFFKLFVISCFGQPPSHMIGYSFERDWVLEFKDGGNLVIKYLQDSTVYNFEYKQVSDFELKLEKDGYEMFLKIDSSSNHNTILMDKGVEHSFINIYDSYSLNDVINLFKGKKLKFEDYKMNYFGIGTEELIYSSDENCIKSMFIEDLEGNGIIALSDKNNAYIFQGISEIGIILYNVNSQKSIECQLYESDSTKELKKLLVKGKWINVSKDPNMRSNERIECISRLKFHSNNTGKFTFENMYYKQEEEFVYSVIPGLNSIIIEGKYQLDWAFKLDVDKWVLEEIEPNCDYLTPESLVKFKNQNMK